MASKTPIMASRNQEEKEKKKIQLKKNLQIFLMIFIPYVCFFKWSSINFLEIVTGLTTLIIILLMIFKGINLKEQKNTQISDEKDAEDVSEKISPEPILYRVSVSGKDIKFSLILSIIIFILDIILLFTVHNVTTLWGFPATVTKEVISYIIISISCILAMISIWLSLKPRAQEKGKNLILFGIQYLFFLVFLSLTYWRYDSTNLGIKTFQLPQALFLVILIVSCLGIGFSLLSGSKKDQLNLLFFIVYFTLGNFAFFFGFEFGFIYIKQIMIVSILCAVIGCIVIKFKNTSKIKINLPTILYGLFLSGTSFYFIEFIERSTWISRYSPVIAFHVIYIWIMFIGFQIMALIQLFLNSNNLKEKLSNNSNYIKMIYFIELIGFYPGMMQTWSFYTISIIILGIINFGLLFMQHRFKINIFLGALILNLIVFIPNILIRLLSNWTYEEIPTTYVESQLHLIIFIGILTSITLAIPLIKKNKEKNKNQVEK
ncbi:hypothetical protein DSAG12_02472 [Promethearchaeum syntrophicum]|uniref:Uncharacterized protein n=1 Tax=Promethearchaeum syntrophicum TaxID=2594042 RepID=A0A5B9DBX9_9ARCH|nr:hypothetical protein [Candidatus Prometheoarchaeum syntrophicum]QEE16642.1 hypothetical protein DSAG12_02472 [Candidatus Prometheoarchaeum syntrophicum]